MRRANYVCRNCRNIVQRPNNPLRGTQRRFYSSANTNTRIVTPNNTSQTQQLRRLRATRRDNSSIGSHSQPVDNATTNPYVTSFEKTTSDAERTLLRPNNLFHSFSASPSPAVRRRAAFMKRHAYCPHPSHQRTRQPTAPFDPENRKPMPSSDVIATASPPAHVRFECPDCGIPVACCEEHWQEDFESHLEVCDTLRQINEDDHDLHSGRFFPEFEYPGPQRAEEFVVNMSNWDTFLYTRDFAAIDDERSMRQVTRLLTYPVTITSVLHELSPYNIRNRGRMTNEGLRSFSALRYTLHPPAMGEGRDTIASIRVKPPPVRIFVLGARAESSLPRDVWAQITHCFPRASFHIIFIGPEAMANREREFPLPPRTPSNPFGGLVEDRLGGSFKITTYVDYFHTMYTAGEFAPFDPYFDVFVLFHPGLGHPASSHEWSETVPQLLETKCPIICTGYTEWDMERDREWVADKMGGEVDVLLEPGENIFRSLRWDLNDLDPVDVSCGNWGLWAFRGKRYEALNKDAEHLP